MNRILAVAANTWREAIRDRIYLALLAFAGLLVLASQVLSPLALGEGTRITRDFGLSGLVLVSLLVAIFVGTGLVQKEIERKTVMTMLSKPIGRGEFVLGKYLGLLATLAVIFVAMTALLMAVLAFRGDGFNSPVLAAAVLSLGEVVIMTGVAIFFSTCTSPVLSGMMTLAVFVAGHFTADLASFSEQAASPLLAGVTGALHWIFPNLELFNVRNAAAHGVMPEAVRFALGAGYALLYTAAILVGSVIVFRRREFR
jgi:ABC-type transport system involved in multi-copper enzyme maturation permease subunit